MSAFSNTKVSLDVHHSCLEILDFSDRSLSASSEEPPNVKHELGMGERSPFFKSLFKDASAPPPISIEGTINVRDYTASKPDGDELDSNSSVDVNMSRSGASTTEQSSLSINPRNPELNHDIFQRVSSPSRKGQKTSSQSYARSRSLGAPVEAV